MGLAWVIFFHVALVGSLCGTEVVAGLGRGSKMASLVCLALHAVSGPLYMVFCTGWWDL